MSRPLGWSRSCWTVTKCWCWALAVGIINQKTFLPTLNQRAPWKSFPACVFLFFSLVFNIHRRQHLRSIHQRYLCRRDNQSLSGRNTFSLHPISWSVICFIANGKSMFIQHTGHANDSAPKKRKEISLHKKTYQLPNIPSSIWAAFPF